MQVTLNSGLSRCVLDSSLTVFQGKNPMRSESQEQESNKEQVKVFLLQRIHIALSTRFFNTGIYIQYMITTACNPPFHSTRTSLPSSPNQTPQAPLSHSKCQQSPSFLSPMQNIARHSRRSMHVLVELVHTVHEACRVRPAFPFLQMFLSNTVGKAKSKRTMQTKATQRYAMTETPTGMTTANRGGHRAGSCPAEVALRARQRAAFALSQKKM